ncbi:restriction endonuclease subunit S [Pontibacter sp. JH31]|uniref:Restriction endonuclease subunit S n=1 Tax=Pontibacter aquaedesilientis TaxID=2766980 RepID=A0ABR7XN20_9BACT|nr:restriction endonuclease subunit S [Pontibacter aquaedesilientis]MBD1398816.1 restriction endonuclease subunit S [Pontibacter aquaedesilientis]
MKNIGREQIKDLLIPLPPEVEQQAIFSKVDQLMQLCGKLEQHIQQSKEEAEALMKAVMQEALQVQEEVIF